MGEPFRQVCGVCGVNVAVKPTGGLRKHPRGAAVPCAGSDRAATPEPAATEASPPPLPPDSPAAQPGPHAMKVRPGVYRSDEPMMVEVEIPPGHVAVAVVAVYPFPGDVDAKGEATRLFDDPSYLYRVLDATPNDRARVQLKVPTPWLPLPESP